MKISVKMVEYCGKFFIRIGNIFLRLAGQLPQSYILSTPLDLPKPSTRKGVEVFDSGKAAGINQARLEHLASLELPIEGKTVLDVGCGVGHLAQFFVKRGCKVTCIDQREENITSLRSRYQGIRSLVVDVESDEVAKLGKFDIVFCYGLLYHSENPLRALRNMESVCKEMLLIESIITDHNLPLLMLAQESFSVNQALRRIGCRPTPSYIALALHWIGFPYIYTPRTHPMHKDFIFKWRGDLAHRREAHPLRCIFIASRIDLQNNRLVELRTTRNTKPY